MDTSFVAKRSLCLNEVLTLTRTMNSILSCGRVVSGGEFTDANPVVSVMGTALCRPVQCFPLLKTSRPSRFLFEIPGPFWAKKAFYKKKTKGHLL